MSQRPFTVLFVDDEAYLPGDPLASTITPKPNLQTLKLRLMDLAKEDPRIQLIVSTSVQFTTDAIFTEPLLATEKRTRYASKAVDIGSLLQEVDVLILDLGDLGALRGINASALKTGIASQYKTLHGGTLPTDSDLDLVTGNMSGIGLVYTHLSDLLETQAVFVLTVYDGGTGASSIPAEHKDRHSVAERWIDPLCMPRAGRPYIAKYWKEDSSIGRMVDRIATLYEIWKEGYTELVMLAQIEEAAMTNEPVMLVGETGTGKEYLAKAIHKRWAQEEIKARRLDKGALSRFVAVNCSVLTPNLAANELFGHIPSAWTDAKFTYLGKILGPGCGGQLGRADQGGTDPVVKFKEMCKVFLEPEREEESGVEKNRQNETPHFILRRPNPNNAAEMIAQEIKRPKEMQPLGTLFLDEFGDLPVEVQAQLLRYLESWEIQPQGLPGVVKGARLRIITATSDPRFAAFAGCKGGSKGRSTEEGLSVQDFTLAPLIGQWRTEEQLAEPLRADLLFRVKGHVVRAQPVTSANAEKVTRAMVRAQQDRAITWDGQAVKALVSEIKTQAEVVERRWGEYEKTGKRGAEPLPLFGHRREISRVIRLAEAWVKSAHERGLRLPTPGVVTKEVVKIVFRPSALFQLPASPPPPPAPPTSPPVPEPAAPGVTIGMLADKHQATDSPSAETVKEIRTGFEQVVQEELGEQEKKRLLPDGWNWVNVRAVLAQPKKQDALRKAVCELRKKYTTDQPAKSSAFFEALRGEGVKTKDESIRSELSRYCHEKRTPRRKR